jgi:hypothetical protein
MEFCRRWGIADWVRDAPYPGDYPQDYVWLTALTGYELGREKFPGRAFEACPPQSPQKRERVPQDMFDPIINKFAISARCRNGQRPRLCARGRLSSLAISSVWWSAFPGWPRCRRRSCRCSSARLRRKPLPNRWHCP